jgi:ribosome-associated toxin RatA of RatAB toxin-antitoxin module
MRISVAMPDFRAVARVEFSRPQQIRFKQIEGNFDYAEGQWDLMPFREGRTTRVFYRVRAGTSMPIPEFVIQSMIETEVPETLKALRAEAVRGAAKKK